VNVSLSSMIPKYHRCLSKLCLKYLVKISNLATVSFVGFPIIYSFDEKYDNLLLDNWCNKINSPKLIECDLLGCSNKIVPKHKFLLKLSLIFCFGFHDSIYGNTTHFRDCSDLDTYEIPFKQVFFFFQTSKHVIAHMASSNEGSLAIVGEWNLILVIVKGSIHWHLSTDFITFLQICMYGQYFILTSCKL
jgi:hypothetical protein